VKQALANAKAMRAQGAGSASNSIATALVRALAGSPLAKASPRQVQAVIAEAGTLL